MLNDPELDEELKRLVGVNFREKHDQDTLIVRAYMHAPEHENVVRSRAELEKAKRLHEAVVGPVPQFGAELAA